MQATKIHKFLSTFSHPERQRFNDFLKSIYFNYNDDIQRLFVALLPTLQKTNPIELTEQEVWKKIFKEKKYDKARFHRICSDLLKEAERFLAYHKFNQNKSLQNAFTLQMMNEKKMMQHLPHLLNQAKVQHQKQQIKDSDFYYIQFLIEAEQNNFWVIQEKRMGDKNIKTVIENLDIYYLSKKLQYCIAFLHDKNLTSEGTNIELVNEIQHYLNDKKFNSIPVVRTQYIILETLVNPDNENYFKELKLILEEPYKSLSEEYLKEVYTFAIQYSIRKINSGNTKYFKELFILYRHGLKRKIMINNNELSPYEYKNIITVALRLGEFDWTEKFIHDYNLTLPKQHRENALTFNTALLFFYKKDYSDVLELLQKVEYNDIFYLLDSKRLLIKTFYELKEFDSLFALLDSFKILLTRKKVISEEYRIPYMRFVTYLKKLTTLTDLQKLNQLRDELITAKQVGDIGWLRDKCEEKLTRKK